MRNRRTELGRARAREKGEVSNLGGGRAVDAGEAPALEKMPCGGGGDRVSNIGSRASWSFNRGRGRRRRVSRRGDGAIIGSGTRGSASIVGRGGRAAGSMSPLGVVVAIGAVVAPAAISVKAVPAFAAPINPAFVVVSASPIGFTGTWWFAIDGGPFAGILTFGFGLGLVVRTIFGGREPVMGEKKFLVPFGGTVFETNIVAKDRVTDVLEGSQKTAEFINGASLETFLKNTSKIGGGSAT